MADKKPLYGDQALARVVEFGVGDTIPKDNAATGTLFDNAAGVPFVPRVGVESTDVQSAIEEVLARLSGGRRQAYMPYVINRQQDRIGRIHAQGAWVAGSSDGSAVLNTHGTWRHLYPFGCFSAYNANGDPHSDDDRKLTAGGPVLVTIATATDLSTNKHMAGFAKFVRTAGSWITDNYQEGKWVFPLGWTAPDVNGRFRVAAGGLTALELTVEDPADLITSEATAADHEVRGTSSGASGHNGYADGVLVLAGALEMGERVHFQASGLLESDTTSDTFVELVLEPNPPLGIVGTDQFAGANRMRMLTGELGATWTGSKRILWECEFYLGYDPGEYHYDWRIAIEDVLSVGDHGTLTGGLDFMREDIYLCPRFRVDRIANLDLYNADWQDPAERLLTFHKYDAEPVH